MARTGMRRSKLSAEVFKDKKYEEDNLRKIKEALRDVARSYGIATVVQFKLSEFYPSPEALQACTRKSGDQNQVMLESFKKFLEFSNSRNNAFKYRSWMFLHYGPLLELFNFAMAHNWGLAREVCYILQLPSYAHLNFHNYYTESFTHILNFLYKWPLAFRKMLQQNSCVNMYGKRGCGTELDCWVESSIVKPVKQHVSGHSTVKTCRRIGSAIDFVKSVRNSYRGKNAFDKHTASRHPVAPPIADQVKGAWFCLSKNLIASDSNQQKPSITGSMDQEKNCYQILSWMWRQKDAQKYGTILIERYMKVLQTLDTLFCKVGIKYDTDSPCMEVNFPIPYLYLNSQSTHECSALICVIRFHLIP